MSFEQYSFILSKYENSIVIDNVRENYKDLIDIIKQLEEHIKENVIMVISVLLWFILLIFTKILFIVYQYRLIMNIINRYLVFHKGQYCHHYYAVYIMVLWKNLNLNL